MAISSPGIGSGLDVNGIVSKLMAVEQQPVTVLDRKEVSYQAQLTAFGTLQGALSSFQSAVSGLSDVSKFTSLKASTADATVLSASASSIAMPGTYSVVVDKLAQSQKLVAVGQADLTTAIGTGVLTFDFGTISGATVDAFGKYTGATFTSNGSGIKTVTIDATNNSLLGIRDAINKANIGVSATVVNDGGASPYRLALTSTNIGQTNSIKITGGDAGLSGLLGHDPANNGGQNLSETVTAQNAQIKVDGIAVSKASNSINDVIQGVTLNLLKTNTSATPTTVTVARDTTAINTAVDSFVKAYNDISKNLKELGSYDTATKKSAILQGDFAVRTIQYQIRNTLNTAISGANSNYNSLSSIGVSFQKDGTLTLDSSKLSNAITTNFDDIAGLFAATGKASDSMVSYTSATANTKPGAYLLEVSQLATQGKAVGSAAAGLTITTGVNDSLSLTVDGKSTTVTLATGVYTAAALALEVQSKVNGSTTLKSAGVSVAVSEAAGVMTMTSTRYGSASNVTVGGNGANNLLGGAPVNSVGVDVAGTFNGATATGSGQYLTGGKGSASEGLKIQVTGGAVGVSRGTVNYTQGYAYKLNALVTSMLSSAGPISTRTNGINRSIKDLGNRREVLNRQLASKEAAYRKQFSALDLTVNRLQTTANALTQQLASIAANSKSN